MPESSARHAKTDWEAILKRIRAKATPTESPKVIRHGDHRPYCEPFPVPIIDGRPQYDEAEKARLQADGWIEGDDGFFYKTLADPPTIIEG